MSKFYIYKGKLWKEKYHFKYTGAKQQFHLIPGKYFVLCDGAHGGIGTKTSNGRGWGGRAMGILNLKKESNLYAYVGGEGSSYNSSTKAAGKGGWNGGGNGGEAYSSNYNGGCGGGGATDIRLFSPEDIHIDNSICKTKYVRLRINANKSNDQYYQITEWKFYDASGAVIPITNISASISDTEMIDPAYSDDGSLSHLVDGLTTTKCCISRSDKNSSFINFYFEFDKEYTIMSYSYITGNDYPERDPISWRIYKSLDNINWELVDKCIRISITNTRIQETQLFKKQKMTWEDELFPDIILPGEYEQVRYLKATNNNSGIVTDYSVTNKTDVEFIGISEPTYRTGFWECLFGTRSSNDSNQFCFGVCWEKTEIAVYLINNRTISNGKFIYNELVRVRTDGNDVRWYRGKHLDEFVNSIETDIERSTSHEYKLCIMSAASSGSTPNTALSASGKCYGFKIYENGTIVRNYVPARRYDGAVGLYCTMTGKFHTAPSSYFTCDLDHRKELPDVEPSLYSRIIVASGGGGGATNETDRADNLEFIGAGGGIVGSYPGGPTTYNYPRQNSGYVFGLGETPPKRTSTSSYGAAGAGGAGGGWFGGYCVTSNSSYSSAAGGGGSGYVLTEDSWKPDEYMIEDDSYNFTDPTLMTGAAEIPQIIIAEEANIVSSGDEIYAFCIGEMDNFTAINPMNLTIECYGARGGARDRMQYGGKGGYAKGTVDVGVGDEIFVTVGDNGFGYNMGGANYNQLFRPTVGFNGGGANVLGSDSGYTSGAPGGGATDVRICSNINRKQPTGPFKYAKIEFLERKAEHIHSSRDAARYFQISELGFNNGEAKIMNIEGFSNPTMTYPLSYNSDQEHVEKLIDGDSSTKFTCVWDGYVVIIIEFENLIDDIESYFITTANDSPCRDPYYWRIYVSNDNEDWSLLDLRYTLLSDARLEKYEFMKNEFSLKEQPSLHNRLIVAGGGGGTGYQSYQGGEGGGVNGGASQNSGNSYQNSGPGTQNSAPTSNTAYTPYGVDGEFGLGGMGITANGGAGGGGGGGWFGGSGVYPNNRYDDDRSGNGGSGYVWTETSWVKPGYSLSSDYWMTDTELITGGNNLQINQQMIKITVNSSAPIKILARDSKGIKRFDEEQDKWIYLTNEFPDKEMFDRYGVNGFKSEIGLDDTYTILTRPMFETVGDKIINVTNVKYHVVPSTQKISHIGKTKINPQSYNLDAEYDTKKISIDLTSKRSGVGDDAQLIVDLKVSRTDEKAIPIIYSSYINALVTGTGNRYIPPKDPDPKPIPKPGDEDYVEKDLLVIGTKDTIPRNYYPYLTDEVTNIYSSVCKIYNRELYIFATLNDRTKYRLLKISITTHRVTLIKEFPSSSFSFSNDGRSIGDLEIFHGRYVVITSGAQNSYSYWYRYDMVEDKIASYNINISSFNLTCFGKIQKINDDVAMMFGRQGYIYYYVADNKVNLSTTIVSARNYRDFTYGEKYYCLSFDGNILTFIDRVTNTVTEKTLNTSTNTVVCYLNGKFYAIQNGILYIIDEETLTIERTDIVPWTNIRTVNISKGILYATQNNSGRIWIYTLSNKSYDSFFAPWTPRDWSSYWPFRPVTLNGTLYFPYWNLMEVSYISRAKYNLGKKYGQYYISYTKEFEDEFEYDSRFVTFFDSHVEVLNGDIIYEGTRPYETTDRLIRSFKISKEDYYKALDISFNAELIDPEN